MTGSRVLRIAARIAVAAFCLMTALYALIASSSFAYLQFLRPHVFPWTDTFANWHAALSWPWLILLAWVVSCHSRHERTRALSWSLLSLTSVAVVWNSVYPILPTLSDNQRSLVMALAALIPLIWLALLEHVRAHALIAPLERSDESWRRFDSRVLVACVTASVVVTAAFFLLAVLERRNAFEPDLLVKGMAYGLWSSLLAHGVVFIAIFLGVALCARIAGTSPFRQHVTWTVAGVALVALIFDRLVGTVLSVPGVFRPLTAVAFAVSVEGTWSGVRFFNGSTKPRRPLSPIVAFGCAVALAWLVETVAAAADWDDVLARVGVAAVWLFVVTWAYGATAANKALSLATVALVCLSPLSIWAAGRAVEGLPHPLARYAVYDASYRTATSLVRSRSGNSAFDRYLNANTGLGDVDVAPVNVDLVPAMDRASRTPPVFLFVIDSLRRDYLSPYNPGVRFTPRIGAFAADSLVFTNAFTRYGGTGLSVPAIWSGSALPHKQYVRPFHPMNGLEKLLDANGYRRFLSLDSIMSGLLEPSPLVDELDRGRDTMDYEFCRTLNELETKLASTSRGTAVFAYSLPQDIHMSRLERWGTPDGDFNGFFAPYASRIQQFDRCFGAFLENLRKLDLYEDSIIVLTADHGEMLGENGQFGHSYHLFPEVVQVPLIIHLPQWVTAHLAVDTSSTALSTDITPTIYAALGYQAVRHGRLIGRSLIDSSDEALTERRQTPHVLAASYGAVYAVVDRDGRRLYIADGVNRTDRLYERRPGQPWTERAVNPDVRAVQQFVIRQHLDETAKTFGLPERQY